MQAATSVRLQGTFFAVRLPCAMLMTLPVCDKQVDTHEAHANAQVTINTLPNTCPAMLHYHIMQDGTSTLTQCLAGPCFFFNCLT